MHDLIHVTLSMCIYILHTILYGVVYMCMFTPCRQIPLQTDLRAGDDTRPH